MFNPFEQEFSEHSQQPTALPVSIRPDPHSASPISFLQLQRLSDQMPEGTEIDPKTEKKVQQLLKEVKVYASSLQQRNLQIACDLEKQRNKNKQLMSALSFLMSTEEQKSKNLEARLGKLNQNNSKLQIEQNRRQMIQSQVKSLRLENNYLKDLILIANDNYEKLQQKNRHLLEKHTLLQQENHQRQIEMLRKSEEIKNVFAVIVSDRNNGMSKGDTMTVPATVNAPQKGNKKEQAEDAYRSIFMKTLKARKQNINKQN